MLPSNLRRLIEEIPALASLSIGIGGRTIQFKIDGASKMDFEPWDNGSYWPPKFNADEPLRFEILHPVETPGMCWSWQDADQGIEAYLTEIVV
jgi:hypothetical protein